MAQTSDEKKAKEMLLNRLNDEARVAWEQARQKAIEAGRQLPVMPAPLEPKHIEYPKWLYNKAKQSKLVMDEDEHKSAGAEWAEAPPKKE